MIYNPLFCSFANDTFENQLRTRSKKDVKKDFAPIPRPPKIDNLKVASFLCPQDLLMHLHDPKENGNF